MIIVIVLDDGTNRDRDISVKADPNPRNDPSRSVNVHAASLEMDHQYQSLFDLFTIPCILLDQALS